MDAITLTRPVGSYNPISLLLRRSKGGTITPPANYQFLTDEKARLLRDERGAYLIDQKEDNNNG